MAERIEGGDPLADPLIVEVLTDPTTWNDHNKYMKNAIWTAENYPTLQEKYPDQFIVVYKERVIWNGTDTTEAREAMRSVPETFQCFYGYIPKPGEIFIYNIMNALG